jgi:hypothetical protein
MLGLSNEITTQPSNMLGLAAKRKWYIAPKQQTQNAFAVHV